MRKIFEILIVILLVIQLGMIALYKKPKEVIAVDMEQLLKEFVVSTANNDMSEDDASYEVRIFAKSIEEFRSRLTKLAEQKNLIILDKRLVYGGVKDKTEQARKLLEHIRNNQR